MNLEMDVTNQLIMTVMSTYTDILVNYKIIYYKIYYLIS